METLHSLRDNKGSSVVSLCSSPIPVDFSIFPPLNPSSPFSSPTFPDLGSPFSSPTFPDLGSPFGSSTFPDFEKFLSSLEESKSQPSKLVAPGPSCGPLDQVLYSTSSLDDPELVEMVAASASADITSVQHLPVKQKRYFKCPQAGCKKHFISPAHLERHIRSHTGEKPFCCDICKRRFSQNSNMMKHRRTVHRKFEEKGRTKKRKLIALSVSREDQSCIIIPADELEDIISLPSLDDNVEQEPKRPKLKPKAKPKTTPKKPRKRKLRQTLSSRLIDLQKKNAGLRNFFDMRKKEEEAAEPKQKRYAKQEEKAEPKSKRELNTEAVRKHRVKMKEDLKEIMIILLHQAAAAVPDRESPTPK